MRELVPKPTLSEVLTDMDAELAALMRHSAKCRALKQERRPELLT